MAARAAHGLTGIGIAWSLSGAIMAAVVSKDGLAGIRVFLGILAGLALLRAILSLVCERAAALAGAKVRRHLFAQMLDHAARLGPVRLAGTTPGELATLLLDVVAGIDPFWRRWMPALAQVVVLPVAILAIVLPFDWITALVLFATIPLLPLFMVLVGRKTEQASRRQWASLVRLGGHLLDAIRGLVDLKILRAADRAVDDVGRMAEAYRHSTMSVLRLAFLSALVLEFFATISIAVVAVLVGFRLLWGDIDFRTGLFLLLVTPEFYAPLRQMGAQRHAKMEAEAAADRVADFLKRPAAPPHFGRQDVDLSRISLRFEAVTVRHDDGRCALDSVSFAVSLGEHVALVGGSGSGKSTILALLAGFLAPESGRILVNDVPLTDLDPAFWRRHLVYLPQQPHFFEASVADNLALGHSIDAAAIDAALGQAAAQHLVAALPEGTATLLGERGHGVSGGEAQRLALARAFLQPAPLILCDEPTAHLDPGTEEAITHALADFAAGRTMVTVAHRLATVRNADRILVLAEGRLVESGRHDDLMARHGQYAALIASARPSAGPVAEALP